MFQSNLLTTFQAVCETGSFEMAAARVHVTPSAVSQRMRALSETAGGALFARLQPATPTDLGQRLLRHAREVGTLEAALATDLGHDQVNPTIPLAINADCLETWAIDALATMPGLCFEITVADQDRTANLLRRGEVAAAVTAETVALPGCDAHALGDLVYTAACTPEFAAHHFKDGPTAKALATAPMLQFNRDDALQHRWVQMVTGQALHPPVHRVPATGPLQHAIRSGLGWGVNPAPLMAADIASGRLVELAPEHRLATPLSWQISRTMTGPLGPLTRAIKAAASHVMSA